MEPEQVQEVDTPPATQDADHGAGANSATPNGAGGNPGMPRDARVTRALGPDGALHGDAAPQVERSAWLRDENYWRTVTYMTATGRRPGSQTKSRPLAPPDRFRSSNPLRSAAVLIVVIALIILIPVGVVIAGNVAAAHITIPSNIPGITLPTATPVSHETVTPAVTPSVTPKKK